MEVEDGRHFENDLDDGAEPDGWSEQLHAAVSSALPEVRAAGHAKPSVYTGEAGACFALLHLAQRGQVPDAASAVDEALRRLQAAESRFDARRVTLLEGAPGSVALQAWAHKQRGEGAAAAACAERLGRLAAHAEGLDDSECEVLYGRCGFLGAILFLRRLLGDEQLLAEPAARLVQQVISAGRRDARGSWPLYFEWHDKCYYGGAHGIAGILLTLLHLPNELALAGEGTLQLVRSTADKLLSQRFRSGNLPSSAGSHRDKCVHWCHGAPGLVPLLVKMSSVCKEPQYLELALQSGDVVWRRGLLRTKGLGLCHGIPGNGYVFLSLYRATGDSLWLRRAQHFGAFAAQRQKNLTPLADRPYSLFEGLAGALCFWADVAHASGPGGAEDVRFPCYEF